MQASQAGLKLLVAVLCAVAAAPAGAQSAYPSKNVQMIVPYTAGGSTDVMARAIAQRLGEMWGRNVLIDNRPGASGMIGTEIAIKAGSDGHVLLVHTSSYPATAAVRASLPFDPARAIVPVAMIAHAPMLVAIHPSVPAKSIKELVALAKKNPGDLKYGSSGTGGNNHFSGALFASAAGIKLTHIPYKGISLAVTALASGEVEIVIASAAALMPQMKSGRVRLLAVTSSESSPLFPDLQPVSKLGVPSYSYELWWGLFAPAGIPADRASAINAAVNKILAAPDMQKFLDLEGARPWPRQPAQLANLLPDELERYRKAAKEADIPMQ